MLVPVLGGIGLFLIGMVLLTDGLKAAAGDRMRDVLQRFTGGPWRGFWTGAVTTAAIQTSSATTVMTIGFVSAGLLTFSQAVGVIIGANVGTTSTGWIVSLLGLRISISAYAMPLIGLGALMKIVGHGRTAAIGTALCGFGILFHGIDVLQNGMRGAAEHLNPDTLGGTTGAGRLLLVLIGIGLTILMQSSSAAIATTLTALHTGSIGLSQAMFLLVGANIGTTVTAALAAVGASIHARRTAAAHVIFNVVTAAFVLIPLLLIPHFHDRVVHWLGHLEPAIALATFHTATKLLGTALFMPWISGYAHLIARIVRTRKASYTSHLDPSLLSVGPVAVEAARRAVVQIQLALVHTLDRVLSGLAKVPDVRDEVARMHEAVHETRKFLAGLHSNPDTKQQYQLHVSTVHAADHVDRLADAAVEATPARLALQERTLAPMVREVRDLFRLVQPWLADPKAGASPDGIATVALRIAEERRIRRPKLLDDVAAGRIDPETASDILEATRWLDRIAYHTWRAFHHLHA